MSGKVRVVNWNNEEVPCNLFTWEWGGARLQFVLVLLPMLSPDRRHRGTAIFNLVECAPEDIGGDFKLGIDGETPCLRYGYCYSKVLRGEAFEEPESWHPGFILRYLNSHDTDNTWWACGKVEFPPGGMICNWQIGSNLFSLSDGTGGSLKVLVRHLPDLARMLYLLEQRHSVFQLPQVIN